MLNLVTDRDAHPLPRIIDILHRQGEFEIWFKLDLVEGFHQIPLQGEHRDFRCITSGKGVFQLTVLVMGLKNAGETIPTNDGLGF